MNPAPLCARIFRLQGRIFPRPSHGVPLLKGTHRGSASAAEPHFSRPVAPSPRGIHRDAWPPADGAAGAVPVRSRRRELRRSPWYAAGHQVPHTHPYWSVRAGGNKGLARIGRPARRRAARELRNILHTRCSPIRSRAPGRCRSGRGSAAPARDPCGKNHVPNVLHDLALRRIVECPAVDKSVRDGPWPCPSTDHSRRVPVSHVDMKVLVAGYLEKHDFAGVRHRPVRLEALDEPFQGFDPCRPSVADVNVSCGDRRRACAAAGPRGGIRRVLRTVFHAQLWTHAFTPCVL